MKMRVGMAVIIPLVAYLSFVGLGLSEGLLGVAWPFMRDGFSLTNADLGVLLLVTTLGYLASSFYSGPIAARLGMSRMLVLGAVVLGGSMFSFVAALSWPMVVLAGLLRGLGAGLVDGGINAFIAANHGPRVMNLVHASYAVGLTLGPLVVTTGVDNGFTWRGGYAVNGLLQIVIVTAFLATFAAWRGRKVASEQHESDVRPGIGTTLRLPSVWMTVGLLFTFAGLTMTIGQWAFPLFTEARGVDETLAATLVSLYWGSFMVGRILFGMLARNPRIETFLRGCMTLMVVGAVLLWWNPAPVVTYGALVVLGLTQAPVFPLLVAVAPKRFGVGHSGNAIGFQIGAANLGAAAWPSLAGTLAASGIGLAVVGPFVTLLAVLVFALHEGLLAVAAPLRRVRATVGD